VRSIDPKQVPSDLNLMGVLKEALSSNEVLWGHLTLAKNITLPDMMDTVAKWKPKSHKSDSAVANYSAQPGNLKKDHGKRQRSGHGNGKDQAAKGVETRACLACKRVGHLVKNCRDKKKRDAWLAEREQKQDKKAEESRGRKHSRDSYERSDSRYSRDRGRSNSRDRSEDRHRERSHSRERSNSRERDDWRDAKKKKSSSKSKTAWMNSDGEQTEDDSDSSYPCFEVFDYLDGERIGLALHANMKADMVCIDSGSNRLVLISCEDVTEYVPVHGRTLGTINSADSLKVEGIGKLGICEAAMHVPNASANLLPTDVMSDAGCTTSFGKEDDVYYCDINCHLGINDKSDIKTITTIRSNSVWWITRDQMVDILFRGGFTIAEATRMQMFRDNRDAVAMMVAERRLKFTDGSFHKKAGERLESDEDYAEHYKALAEDAAAFQASMKTIRTITIRC